MLHTVIFIGRSGCGKGTQADLLKEYIREHDADKRHLLYVETGEHFRRLIRQDNYSAKLALEVHERDERQPDFLACSMWGKILIEELDENMHIIFDGAPRAIDEAHVLTTAMKFYKREKPTIIYLDVSRRWSEDRLLARRRMDDRGIAHIDKRLNWFDADTLPALEYFKSDPFYRVLEINGEQEIDKVHSDIVEAYSSR
ncbi:MAG: nucleoside monophosphate kinase [bacterium]|nr:nucleoside monophosphate kinase [bacterium]